MTHIRTLMDQMIQIDEGRMKDIFTADQEGQSAKEIAKALNLPLGTVKKILGEEEELKEFTASQLDILSKQYAGMSGKTISIDQANKLRKIFKQVPDSAMDALRKKKIPFLSGLALSRMVQKGMPVKEDKEEPELEPGKGAKVGPAGKIALAKEKDTDALEAQLVTAKGQIELLKTKLENEKNKAVKPEPNKETGEVPLTVGVAHKYLKDKAEKEKEEVKKEETIIEFKKMTVSFKTHDMMSKASTDLAKQGFTISGNQKALKVDGKGADLNKYATDLKNNYGATIVAEENLKEADPITYGPDKVAKAMAIAVKSDGQYSKAVREIEKIGKDLSKVSTIARALKTANEEKQMNEAKEKEMYYLEFDVDSSKEWVTGPDRVPGKPKAGPDRALAGIEVEEQVKAASMEEAFRHFKQVILKYTNRMKGKLKLNVKFMGTFPRVSAENKRGERLTQQLSKDIERRTMRNEDVHAGARLVYEQITGLKNKAEKTGMPYGVLKKVYDRGMAAWRGGHRPGTTQQQWAFARVNSFVTKSSGTWGGADKDLAKQVTGKN